MSEQNAEWRALAESAYAALNASDIDRFVSFTTEDVEFSSLIAEAEGASFRGHDGVRAWWETVVASFQDVHWDLLETTFGPDGRGVLHLRIAGTLGGVPVEQTMWQASEVRDGRISWWAVFRTEREALNAAGLPEGG